MHMESVVVNQLQTIRVQIDGERQAAVVDVATCRNVATGAQSRSQNEINIYDVITLKFSTF